MTVRLSNPERAPRARPRACSAALCVLLLATGGGLGQASLAAPAASPKHTEKPTDKSGDPLELATAKLFYDAYGAGACSANAERSVVLWFFDDDKLPVPASTASLLHAELAQLILSAKPECVARIV